MKTLKSALKVANMPSCPPLCTIEEACNLTQALQPFGSHCIALQTAVALLAARHPSAAACSILCACAQTAKNNTQLVPHSHIPTQLKITNTEQTLPHHRPLFCRRQSARCISSRGTGRAWASPRGTPPCPTPPAASRPPRAAAAPLPAPSPRFRRPLSGPHRGRPS